MRAQESSPALVTALRGKPYLVQLGTLKVLGPEAASNCRPRVMTAAAEEAAQNSAYKLP